MERNAFETLFDAIDAVEEDGRGGHDITVLPPHNDPYASDEEIGDDDIGLVENLGLPNDVTGNVEVQRRYSDDEEEDDESNAEIRWKKGDRAFQPMPNENPILLEETHDHLLDKSILEIFKLFFDEEVENLIISSSTKYARQKNDQSFSLTKDQLWDFLSILTISTFNMRPQFSLYWSVDEDVSCPLIKSLMTRNMFCKIKSYLHVCDNENLIQNDKWAKLRPLIEMVNEKLIQFGVFSKHLSIDEQMVPYFGRHSCKMFIRGKPIRFGYKNWVLTTDDGYPLKIIPYQGKEYGNTNGPLGPRVVKSLLEVVEKPNCHEVYFDNFFTSVQLLKDLKEGGIRATGTVRNNRIGNCPLTPVKTMEKKDRGSMEEFSSVDVCAVRWVDNKVVTVMSNHMTSAPISQCRRYSRAEKARVNLPQPNTIKHYNAHMGGVDQLDGYLNNLRPSFGGKKWYWSQLINMLRILQVAAFRLYANLHSDEKISQLSFLRALVHQHIRFQRSSIPEQPEEARIVPLSANNHALATFSQGRCKICQKNTKKGCIECNVRLHERCFPVYHV